MTLYQKTLIHMLYTIITLLAMLWLVSSCSPDNKVTYSYVYKKYTVRDLRIDSDGEYHFIAIDDKGQSITLYDEDPDSDFKVIFTLYKKEPGFDLSVKRDNNTQQLYRANSNLRPDKLYIPYEYDILIIED